MNKGRLVSDIYHRGVIFCKPDTPLQEVVHVLADTEIHAIMVAEREDEQPLDVVTHTDIIEHYSEDLTKIEAQDTMTPHVVTISESETIAVATERMLSHRIHRLLVTDVSGKPVGILSTTDIIREMRVNRWVWHLD
jgi:predicted transcriptional regulator